MRSSLSLILCCLIIALAGCGGGGSSSPAEVTGVWTGNFATRASGTLEVDFTRSGTTLSGTARLTLSGTIYTGSLTGTLTNGQLSATVVYDGGYGTATYSATISGTTMTGTFTHGAENGTVSLDKNVGVQTPSIAGAFTGTFTQAGQSAKSLSVNFTQTGDTFTATYSANGGPNVNASGTIIGPNITYGVAQDPSGAKVTFSGTVSSDGKSMSGNYTATGNNQSVSGTWSVSKPTT